MNEEEKKVRDMIDAQIKELSIANYEGNIKAIAIVCVDTNMNMRTHVTIPNNLVLAVAGAMNLFNYEICNLSQTMFRKEEKPNE